MTFLIFLLAFYLNNLTAASEEETFEGLEDALPVFAFNHEVLVKPEETACMQWLELLEIERNKADYLGNFQAFKAFTKEISATIGGKYGISIPTTQDEIITLSYSIIRTRHKFCGKHNMLSDFYGVRVVADDPEVQHYLAMILAIDAMTFEAIDEEDDVFFYQWSAVNAIDSTAEAFTAAVKGCIQEKESLVIALNEPLTAFLTTDSATIALAKEVFDIFAPKITLKKIYNEMMVGSEYRGWTVHGADAFAYPISISKKEGENYPDADRALKALALKGIIEEGDSEILFCTSTIARFVSVISNNVPLENPEDITLEYVYDSGINVASFGFFSGEIKGLTLSRKTSPSIECILKKPRYKISKEDLLKDYQAGARIRVGFESHTKGFSVIQAHLRGEVNLLAAKGIPNTIYNKAVLLFNGLHGFGQNVSAAFDCYKEAMDLGCAGAKKNFPIFLNNYAVCHFYGQNGIARNAPKAIDICREAVALNGELAKLSLPVFLHSYAIDLFYGENGISRDIPAAIKFCREAANLGDERAKENLSSFLGKYSVWLFHGQNGIAQDIPHAIDICCESADLGDQNAIRNLPQMVAFILNKAEPNISQAREIFREHSTLGYKGAVNNFAIRLYNHAHDLAGARNGFEKNISEALGFLRKAADLGDEDAKHELPSSLRDYANDLFYGNEGIERDMPQAIKICREEMELGEEDARTSLANFLNSYGICVFNGEKGIARDVPKAIEILRESKVLGSKDAEHNLTPFLRYYAFWLFHGENGIAKNIPHSIEVFREAAVLGDEDAKQNLNAIAISYLKGKYGMKRDVDKAISLFREAAALGNKDAQANLPTSLTDYANELFCGENRTTRDAHGAIDLLREAANLSYRLAIDELPRYLSVYSSEYADGTNGTRKSLATAIELCRESAALNYENAIYNLPIYLYDYAIECFEGIDGTEKNIPLAVELCRESAALGDDDAKDFLPHCLNSYAIRLIDGTHGIKKDISMAIEVCREAADLGNEDAIRNLPLMIAAAESL